MSETTNSNRRLGHHLSFSSGTATLHQVWHGFGVPPHYIGGRGVDPLHITSREGRVRVPLALSLSALSPQDVFRSRSACWRSHPARFIQARQYTRNIDVVDKDFDFLVIRYFYYPLLGAPSSYRQFSLQRLGNSLSEFGAEAELGSGNTWVPRKRFPLLHTRPPSPNFPRRSSIWSSPTSSTTPAASWHAP